MPDRNTGGEDDSRSIDKQDQLQTEQAARTGSERVKPQSEQTQNRPGSGKISRRQAGQPDVRLPARWLYLIINLLFQPPLRLIFGVRIHRDRQVRGLQGPLLILGNHPSYFDPMLMCMAMPHRRINFVAANFFFRWPLLRQLFKWLGVICKIQFRADSHAVRQMFQVIRKGGALGMFAEGQRSLDGGPQPMDEAVAKLAKKLAVPIVVTRISGAYLSWPRWSANGFRPGRIDVNVRLALSAEQVKVMSWQEIYNVLLEAMAFQDYEWQRRRKQPAVYHKYAPARGLENLCHQCPSCRRDLAMTSTRKNLICRYCGHTVRLDRSGFFRPVTSGSRSLPDPHAWHAWQKEDLTRRFSQPGFSLETDTRLDMAGLTYDFQPAGQGKLILNRDELIYQGDIHDESVTLRFPLQNRSGFNAVYGRRFEIVLSDLTYRFRPFRGQCIVQFADAFQMLDKPGTNA